jgi:hypothetical protein
MSVSKNTALLAIDVLRGVFDRSLHGIGLIVGEAPGTTVLGSTVSHACDSPKSPERNHEGREGHEGKPSQSSQNPCA